MELEINEQLELEHSPWKTTSADIGTSSYLFKTKSDNYCVVGLFD